MARFSKALRRERRRCYIVVYIGFQILVRSLAFLFAGEYLGAAICLMVAIVQLAILARWTDEISEKMKAEKRNAPNPPRG